MRSVTSLVRFLICGEHCGFDTASELARRSSSLFLVDRDPKDARHASPDDDPISDSPCQITGRFKRHCKSVRTHQRDYHQYRRNRNFREYGHAEQFSVRGDESYKGAEQRLPIPTAGAGGAGKGGR